MPHHAPTGDLHSDLIKEVTTFRTGLEQQGLDRALYVLAELARTMPELVEVRKRFVTDGERVLRALLRPYLRGAELEAATLMLVGAILQGTMMHGKPLTDRVIAASVDLVLAALGRPPRLSTSLTASSDS